MSNKIYIRADAGRDIGLGHIVRCVALSHMLEAEFRIHFISKEIPESVAANITAEGFSFTQIAEENEFFDLLTGDEIVVLDHYGLDSSYQKKIKTAGSKLVCIDDLHDKKFYADLIINHSPSAVPENYEAQAQTEFALGLEYALLRPPFLHAAKQERVIEEVESVFICFGGSDAQNLTEKCLKAVLETGKFTKISVVLGAANVHRDSVKKFSEQFSEVKLFFSLDSDEILDLMRNSDMAIVPASGILLEVLAVGSLPLIGYCADNQRELFRYFQSKGYFQSFNGLDFNPGEFKSTLLKLKDEYYDWHEVEIRSQIKDSPHNHLVNFKTLQNGRT